MAMPRVPVELSDCIIDYLHDNNDALKACALTCHAWRPAARLHIFHTVALSNPTFIAPFRRLLHKTPDIGWYVRELSVAKFVEARDVFMPAKRPDGPPLEKSLPQIFKQLPNLHSLTFSHMDMKCIHGLRGLAHASVAALSLSYCQFAEFADIVDLVGAFPSLAALSMAGLTWTEEKRAPEAEPAPISTLRRLSLGREMDSEKVFEWLAVAAFHTSVTDLTVRLASERDADLFGPFLKLARTSVRQLDLDWNLSGDKTIALPPSLSLGECTALESLAMHFPVNYSTSLPWVASLLGTLETASIRSVSCDIRLCGNIDALGWDALGTVLASEGYRKLEALKFAVSLWPSVHQDLEEVDQIIRARLAALDKKGIVHVSKA